MNLRPYQQKSIDMLYEWIGKNEGHPVVCLPTGAGKSVVIASLCKNALDNWKDTRILMLVSSKELLSQNAEKIRYIWPNAPLGIYSASLRKRDIGEPITYANIGSVRTRANLIGHIDLCIVDECDMISHKDEGSYRNLLNDLLKINPNMRIVGYTASPYRLGHGLITDKPALFDDIIEPVTIKELIKDGYLSPLRSKITKQKLSTEGVHKRGGEFIESELQSAVDKYDINDSVVKEVIEIASDRKHWLFFCSGIEHADHVKESLIRHGIVAESLSGETSSSERDRIINNFKAGKIQALTNCNILTVGFDFPDLDCIVMLRPTMSPRLYLQCAGRGTRLKKHIDNCLFLDFASAVEKHGPITDIAPPKKAGSGDGQAPCRVCPDCHEICHVSVMTCPACGHEFPEAKEKEFDLNSKFDIMGFDLPEMELTGWEWTTHLSKKENRLCFKISYYGALSDPVIKQYLCVLHDGFAGARAMRELTKLADSANISLKDYEGLKEVCEAMNNAKAPDLIKYKKVGKFYEVKEIIYNKGDLDATH